MSARSSASFLRSNSALQICRSSKRRPASSAPLLLQTTSTEGWRSRSDHQEEDEFGGSGIRLQSWMKRIHCCGGGAGEVKSAAEDEGETLLQQSRVRSFSWKRFKGLIERLPRFWRCCRSPDC
ncbi:uncharacterized protein LOC144713970 isoform X2 [Wolffia australiana]